jgi:hypothetical protein
MQRPAVQVLPLGCQASVLISTLNSMTINDARFISNPFRTLPLSETGVQGHQ